MNQFISGLSQNKVTNKSWVTVLYTILITNFYSQRPYFVIFSIVHIPVKYYWTPQNLLYSLPCWELMRLCLTHIYHSKVCQSQKKGQAP